MVVGVPAVQLQDEGFAIFKLLVLVATVAAATDASLGFARTQEIRTWSAAYSRLGWRVATRALHGWRRTRTANGLGFAKLIRRC